MNISLDNATQLSGQNNQTAKSAPEKCISEYSDTYARGVWFNDAAPWAYLGISIVGVVLNAIVIWLLGWRRMPMSKNPRILVINQSIIDLATCVLTGIKWSTVYMPSRVSEDLIGTIVCHLWYSQSSVFILVNSSTFNLQLITLERFLAIVRPMVRRPLWKIRLGCCLMWLLGFAHQWKGITDFRRGSQPATRTCCVLSGLVPAQLAFAYGILNFVAKFAFPLVNMLVCYTWMIAVLRHKTNLSAAAHNSDDASKSNRKLAASWILIKTFTIAGVAYIMCFAPNQINYILFSTGIIAVNFQTFFYNITLFLVNSNALVNPVIYFAFMPRFRQAFIAAFCTCRNLAGPGSAAGETNSSDYSKRNSHK